MVKLHIYGGTWEECLVEIKRDGGKPTTIKECMQERIRHGRTKEGLKIRDNIVTGSWFPENVNYIRGKVLWALAEYNPLIPYARQVVMTTRKEKEFLELSPVFKLHRKPVSRLLLEIAEEDATKPVWERRVLDAKNKRTFSVPPNRLGEVEEAIFLARGEQLARDYGTLLFDALKFIESIYPTQIEISFFLAEFTGLDFAAGFWHSGLYDGDRFAFRGHEQYLDDYGGCLYGTFEKSAKGTSKKA